MEYKMYIREELKKLESNLKGLLFKNFSENEEVSEEFIKEVYVTIKQQILKDESGIFKLVFSTEKDVDNFINEIIEETKMEQLKEQMNNINKIIEEL